MEAVKINLDDYVQSGAGFNGASYDMKSDPNVMVKLYNEDYPKQPIIDELEVAKKVYELGVASPEPGCLVTDGKRLGIKFRRIVGKRSFSRMLADEPERTEEYARIFARACKNLHATECPKGLFPEAKEQFIDFVKWAKELSESEKKVIIDFIESVPECNTALHGDMHIGNAITTLAKGADLNSKYDIYFIDLGYFSRGCPLYDVGMFYNVCNVSDDNFIMKEMHITGGTAREVWNYFVDEYFFADDNLAEKWFGKGANKEIVVENIKKYTAVKLLFVSFNIGFILEHFLKFIKEAFKL